MYAIRRPATYLPPSCSTFTPITTQSTNVYVLTSSPTSIGKIFLGGRQEIFLGGRQEGCTSTRSPDPIASSSATPPPLTRRPLPSPTADPCAPVRHPHSAPDHSTQPHHRPRRVIASVYQHERSDSQGG